MAKRPVRPGFRFPGPVPKEALEFFQAKKLRPSFSHLDVAAEEHALNFTVAKSVGYDILGDVHGALVEHLEGGGTLRTFEKQLTPILQKKGWWGEQEVTDPQTGKKVLAQLGSPRRLRTIFRANMRSARAAGQWERIQRTKRTHPYLLYRLGPSREHRDEHVAWNGTLLPADDEFWNDHFPPNGWGCKCWVRQVSRAEAGRLGGRTDRPPRDEVEWANPRTGDRMRVDRGLDPSWAGNAGRDRARLLAAVQARDIAGLALVSAGLARAAIRETVESAQLERQFAPLKPGQALGGLPVAFLPERRARLLGAEPGAFFLKRKTARKQLKAHHRPNPKWPDSPPIDLDDYRALQEIVDGARDEHVVASGGHRGADRDELLFAYQRGGAWDLLVVAKDRAGNSPPYLATFYKLPTEGEALGKLAEARARAKKRDAGIEREP